MKLILSFTLLSIVFFSCSKTNQSTTPIDHCRNLVNDTTATTDSTYVLTPNYFTPNNDGINDFWLIARKGIQKLSYVIYDSLNNIIDSGQYNTPTRFFQLKANADSFYHYYYTIEATTVTNKTIGECGDLYIIYNLNCHPSAINKNYLIGFFLNDPNDPVLINTCK
jgi:gliding motility-associated-like protein